jgi:hypothetical protein
MLARYIKPKQPVKFYGRLEAKYNKTMNDKKISTEMSKDIIVYSNSVRNFKFYEWVIFKPLKYISNLLQLKSAQNTAYFIY